MSTIKKAAGHLKIGPFLLDIGHSIDAAGMRLALLVLLSVLAESLWATDPGAAVKTAVAAKGSVPGLVRAGKGIVAIPWHVAQCLRLPLGLAEMVFSPFPGVDFSDGLEDTGKGIVAPFKLCVATLEMPVEVFGGLGDAVTGLVD